MCFSTQRLSRISAFSSRFCRSASFFRLVFTFKFLPDYCVLLSIDMQKISTKTLATLPAFASLVVKNIFSLANTLVLLCLIFFFSSVFWLLVDTLSQSTWFIRMVRKRDSSRLIFFVKTNNYFWMYLRHLKYLSRKNVLM